MSDAHNSTGCPDLHAADEPDTAAHLASQSGPHLVTESLPLAHASPQDPDVTVGELKALLADFAHAPRPAGVELAAELRQVYDLLCTQALACGVDPARAMRREVSNADSHRPHLVPAPAPDKP